jgi:hypothetical protein
MFILKIEFFNASIATIYMKDFNLAADYVDMNLKKRKEEILALGLWKNKEQLVDYHHDPSKHCIRFCEPRDEELLTLLT